MTDLSPFAQEEAALAWVEAFADGWRAPTGADAAADHFEPWIDPMYRFNLPAMGGRLVGRRAFREQFSRSMFELLSAVHGTVGDWAYRGDTLFVELRLEARVGSRPVTLELCDRVVLRDGRALDRFTYVDPRPMFVAVARSPRMWWPAIRVLVRSSRAIRAAAAG